MANNPNNISNNVQKSVEQTAKKISDTASRDYPELKDIKENVSDLKSNSAALARHVYADGREALSTTTERAGRGMDSLREAGRSELSRLEDRIRANPTQGVVVAFAAGLIASFLFGRK